MNKNKKMTNFKNASLSIEASIVFIFLSALLVFVANSAYLFVNKSRLESLSYSLATLARSSELGEINQEKAQKIYDIAKLLSKDFVPKDALSMSIEILSFKELQEKKEKLSLDEFSFGDCKNDKDLEDFESLSVYTNKSRYSSIYRLNLCYEETSKFLWLDNLAPEIFALKASSIVVER